MNILLLGDSLIEYFDWQERFPEHNVANRGIAGESVGGLLSRVVKIKEVVPAADMIFIMSGINNLAMDDLGFMEFYEGIIEKLTALYPEAKTYIHSLLPTAISYIPNESVCSVNDSLRTLAKDSGVEYVDLYRRFTGTGGSLVREYLLEDGIHISRAGYDVWARVIEEIIASD